MALPNGDLIDAEGAAKLLGKTPATIRQYAHRGIKLVNGQRFYLRPAGLDPRGQNLYRLTDLAIVAHNTTARGTSRAHTITAA